MNGINNIVDPSASFSIRGIDVNAAHKKVRRLFLWFFLILFTMAAPLPLIAEEPQPHRGIFPECQKTCLSTHEKNMEILIEKYELEGDKVSFQDAVDSALHEYSKCVANCRIPMPIK